MKKVVFFTNMFSHYDEPLWKLFLKEDTFDFKFYFSENSNGIIHPKNINSLKNTFPSKLNLIKSITIGKILIWQFGVIKKAFFSDYDIYIFNGEMNCFSTWISALILKIRKKTIVFWGHGLYGNEGFLKLKIRLFFYRLANYNFVYENHSKNLLNKYGFEPNKILTVYNSLDYVSQKSILKNNVDFNKNKFSTCFLNSNLFTLIFIGRLTKRKKIDFLIRNIKKRKDINLYIIGNGNEKTSLTNLSFNCKNIFFHGDEYNEIKLANIIANSDLCVSPGNIGLSAVHCLTYGTPIATHNDFNNQMPEAEIIIDGFNGFFFDRNSNESFIEKLNSWIINHDREKIRKQCYSSVLNYTPQNQLKIIKKFILSL